MKHRTQANLLLDARDLSASDIFRCVYAAYLFELYFEALAALTFNSGAQMCKL